MTTICWHCDLTSEEYKIVKELSDDAFRVSRNHQIKKKKGIEYTTIADENITLLQIILKYILSAYSLYDKSEIKTIPIDYEYVGQNIKKIKKISSKLHKPKMFYVSRYIGKKQIDESDDDLPIPLFLCDVKYEPIKDKK